jgi:hypothetical protein
MPVREEHRADYADSQTHAYSQSRSNYRPFAKQLHRPMSQIHRAGEKLFIHYADPIITLTDSGHAYIFVASLGPVELYLCLRHAARKDEPLARIDGACAGVPRRHHLKGCWPASRV